MGPSPVTRRFLSLKWKAAGGVGLLLAALVTSLTVWDYNSQFAQFEHERHQTHLRYQTELQGVLEQTQRRLRQTGTLISTLQGLDAGFSSGDPEVVRAQFGRHWPLLQINQGLEVAQLYSPDATLLGAWGSSGLPETSSRRVPPWVLEASVSEQAQSRLACDSTCLLYAAVPIILDGRKVGVVVLGTSLAESMIGFHEVSKSQVALLSPGNGGQGPRMGRWDLRVLVATQSAQTTATLVNISTAFPARPQPGAVLRAQEQGRNYEAFFFEAVPGTTSGPLVAVVTDITDAVTYIRGRTAIRLIGGAAGLLVAGALLLALLSRPLFRLERISTTLPLLAESRYDEVRGALPEAAAQEGRSEDEVDRLQWTATVLADQLEALENQVSAQQEQLQERMATLQRERDFVHGLVNSAPVMVLTFDAAGRVVSSNRFAQEMLGVALRPADPVPFETLLEEKAAAEDPVGRLRGLASRKSGNLRLELPMRTVSGSACHIAWVYTPLAATEGPAILGVGIDLTGRKKMETRLSWLSDHDPLTGLANRTRFTRELAVAIETAKRYRRTGAFLLLDLDHFRTYNQTAGHAAGDMLLTAVAQALRRAARSADLVGRFGSDEFGILLREVAAEEMVGVARKFGKILREELRLPVPDEAAHRLSASMGLVMFPGDAQDGDAAFTAANQALNIARSRGHGTLHVYSDTDGSTQLVQGDVYWRNRVEQALIYDGFVLHYQPILHLETDSVTHYEALVRMVDADGSLVAPGRFIPACEQTGLIHSLDYLVLEKAVALMARLTAERQHLRFSVNVSARTLEHEEFLGTVRQVLGDHGVAPERLILELTETSSIGNLAAARQIMQELRALGCSLALDDFGVGFSSLVYLKELPVDFVKVDGAFVRELNENKGDQILVRSVRDIAHAYGTRLVAEYVESAELLELVREYGVDYAQGYEIGRPAAVEALFPEAQDDPNPQLRLL